MVVQWLLIVASEGVGDGWDVQGDVKGDVGPQLHDQRNG